MPRLSRAQGLLAVGLGLAVASCSTDDPASDLDSEGPPRVITVNVQSESAGEVSTYCASEDDEKVNALYCPSDGTVTDALPIGWRLRTHLNGVVDRAGEELGDRRNRDT